MNSTVQAKVVHELIQRNGRLAGLAVGFQGGGAEVGIFQVIDALLD
jgi:hypothetical protein